MDDSTDDRYDERIIWEQETLESIMAGIDIEHHHEHVARGATHPSSVDAPFAAAAGAIKTLTKADMDVIKIGMARGNVEAQTSMQVAAVEAATDMNTTMAMAARTHGTHDLGPHWFEQGGQQSSGQQVSSTSSLWRLLLLALAT